MNEHVKHQEGDRTRHAGALESAKRDDEESTAELSPIAARGRELGSSFLPLSQEQADAIRQSLLDSIDMTAEARRIEARS